jgi:HSP20 family protein
LRIEGSRERVRRSGSERHHLVERICGHFVRTIRLPVDADVHRMRVRLEQGVLTVEIPRARGRRVR